MNIFLFIQQESGIMNRMSIEALTGAQKMAADTSGTVTAVVLGTVPESLKGYDVKEIIQVSGTGLETYSPLPYITAMQQVIEAESPDLTILGHTYEARDWVPRLAARLDLPFVVDCIGYETGEKFSVTRQVYQGKINATIQFDMPAMVSFQSGVYRSDQAVAGSADIRRFDADLSAVPATIRPGEKFQEAKGSVDLSRAEIIVSIGRGVGKEENMHVMEEFATALGAELGSSRPVVDYGWLPHERQVGSSGQTVSPKLYIAVGLSGAIQHQVGMKGSDNIVAINKDPNAPIFEIADIGIVEDLFEIIPKLTEAINGKK